MKVGGFLVGDGIDYWALAQEFKDAAKPTEKRIVLFRETFLELHINPITTDELNKNPLLKDVK